MAAHGAPYVAQLSPNKWKIMAKGFSKGTRDEGPCFYKPQFQLVH